MPKTKTIKELRGELKAKELVLGRIKARRAKLQAKLDAIDRKIVSLTGGEWGIGKGRAAKAKAPVVRRARRRRRGGKSLVQIIQEVLAAAPKGLRVRDAAAAAVEAGYKSASKNFYSLVAAAISNPKLFKKIGRGVYQLR